MKKRILVINPNSNDSVTQGLDASLESLRSELGVEVDCHTIPYAPFGIETDEDIATVAPMVVDWITDHGDYDAYVIACYSDPGLDQQGYRQ